jgi:hypothetical protein
VSILEVAIVSNYIWTEKQIQAAIKRLSHKKGWLGVAEVRSGNKEKAPEYRQLMSILVERGEAFGNDEFPESSSYKICFNWDKQIDLLQNLSAVQPFFTPGLLSNPRIVELPLSIPAAILEANDISFYDLTPESFDRIQEICKEPLQYSYKLWKLELSALQSLQDTGKLKFRESPNWASKALLAYLLAAAHEKACMYKALRIGWGDICRTEIDGMELDWRRAGLIPDTADSFFIQLLGRDLESALASTICSDPSLFTSRTTGRYLSTMATNEWAVEALTKLTPNDDEYLLVKQLAEDYECVAQRLDRKQSLHAKRLKDLLTDTKNICFRLLFTSQKPKAVEAAGEWLDAYNEVLEKVRSWSMHSRSSQ